MIFGRRGLCVVMLLGWVAGATLTSGAGILVLFPHPDDDVLTAAGVIRNATRQGVSVKIVYVTNGDLSPEASAANGLQRQEEAVVAATNFLGLAESDLLFLGYPDAGLSNIFHHYTAPTSSRISWRF